MDYTLIIAFLAFFGALQLCNKFNVSPGLSSSVAVGVPFVVNLCLKWIYVIGYKLPLFENLFSLVTMLSVAVQFVVAFFVFRKIQSEDRLGVFMAWGVAGSIVVILGVPLVLSFLL